MTLELELELELEFTMLSYILKRILFFIPTLIGVSILVFLLGHIEPYDPCPDTLEAEYDVSSCEYQIKRLHLDKPIFYFNLTTRAYPKDLYRISRASHRENLHRMIAMYGNWFAIQKYYNSITYFNRKVLQQPDNPNHTELYTNIRQKVTGIFTYHQDEEIRRIFKVVKEQFSEKNKNIDLYKALITAEESYENVLATATPNKNYLPALHFYGLDNQYHLWITNFVKLDFGESYASEVPVVELIREKMPITLILSSIAIVLAYLIAIQLGVLTAVKKGTRTDSTITTGLFMLYSVPNFWIGMMMIVFLTSPDFWAIFPPGDAYDKYVQAQGTFGQRLWDYIHHLFLPIICWTYPALAFLSRQMRGGMLKVMSEDYIRTAKAKGLPPKKIIWKHSFKNALIPIATMLGNVFPRLIAGSIVLEWIFNIEGMGLLLYRAINLNNHPVVMTIVMLIAVLTVIGYLVSDLLYAYLDPRVSFKQSKS